MPVKEKNKSKIIGDQIKLHLNRNQRWLSDQICMTESRLSEKMNGRREFTQSDLDKINKALGTSFKL